MVNNRLVIAVVLTAALVVGSPILDAAAAASRQASAAGIVPERLILRESKTGSQERPAWSARVNNPGKIGQEGASQVRPCRNRLVRVLREAGFRGKNLKEAWAIAMRESGGRADIGPGHPDFNGADVGMFQFNMPAYVDAEWWNTQKLMTARYSAKIAYRLSRGGKTWYPWGLDGKGRTNARVYSTIWSKKTIRDRITRPYRYWYGQYPC